MYNNIVFICVYVDFIFEMLKTQQKDVNMLDSSFLKILFNFPMNVLISFKNPDLKNIHLIIVQTQ